MFFKLFYFYFLYPHFLIVYDMKINWNVIRGHNWYNDDYYNKGIDYIENPAKVLQFSSHKAKLKFKKRMQFYTVIYENSWPIDKKVLAIVDNNIPFYIQTTLYTGTLPVVYKVVRPSEKSFVLKKFIDNVDIHALNSKTLYDKILRANLLGISRDFVVEWLKNNNNVKVITNTAQKPVIESFRPNFPFEYMQIDYIDMIKYEKSNNGYSYIIVIIDIFSKYIYAFPIKSKTASITQSVLKKLFLSGDIPSKLGSDNEKSFSSEEVVSLCNHFGIIQIYGKPHSPQTQGFVENKNKQIKNSIIMYMNKYKTYKYYDMIDSIVFAINNAKHSVTKLSPMEVHRGRHLSVHGFDNIVEPIEFNDTKEDKLTTDIVKKQLQLYDERTNIIRQKLYSVANKREKQHFDKTSFKPGTYVQISTYQLVNNSDIQPIQIKLTLFNNTNIYPQNPLFFISKQTEKKKFVKDLKLYKKSIFSKVILKKNKWSFNTDSIFRHSFFIISEVTKNSKTRKFNYKLFYIDPNQNDYKYQVHRLVDYEKEIYTTWFNQDILQNILIDDLPDLLKKPERPSFNFLDLFNHASKTKKTNKIIEDWNPTLLTKKMIIDFFARNKQESDRRYQKRITKQLDLPNVNNVENLNDINKQVVIDYVFKFKGEKPYLKPEEGYILSFDMNRGKANDDEKLNDFFVFFPNDDDEKLWDLKLDPQKYGLRNNKGKFEADRWIFKQVRNFTVPIQL